MSKERIGKIVSIALVALVSLLAVFGYDIGVIQPREASGILLPGAEMGERGMTANVLKLDNLQVRKSITSNGTLTQVGATTIGGALGVTGALAADGGITVDTTNFTVNGTTGNVGTAGSLNVVGSITSANDLTLSADSTGGNAGAKTEFIGLPRIKLIGGGQGTNPGSQTIALFDDSPAGEWAPVDASVVETAEAVIVKYGSGSYKAAFAADAAAGDGIIDAALGAGAAWDDMESAGLLVMSSAAWAEGDLTLVLTDDGGARTFNIPALTRANVWTWLEVDIATGDLSAVSDVAIKLSTAGATALGAFDLYVDIAYVWDSVDEEALGVALQQDGVLGVINTETGANLVELTDYVVHYQDGNDAIVYITDQSAADVAVLAAY